MKPTPKFITAGEICCLIAGLLLALSTVAQAYIVNSAGDEPAANPGDGTGLISISGSLVTLRSAIEDANALGVSVGISFYSPPFQSPRTYIITPATPLPVITAPVEIFGLATSAGTPVDSTVTVATEYVQLAGSYGTLSFDIQSAGRRRVETVTLNGIYVKGWVPGASTLIDYCYIGTDRTGMAATGDAGDLVKFPGAITLEATHNCMIGFDGNEGDLTYTGNVICGSKTAGIYDRGNSSFWAGGNYIGINVSGTTIVSNSGSGIVVGPASSGTIGFNIISGNGGSAIAVSGSNSLINDNVIGGFAPLLTTILTATNLWTFAGQTNIPPGPPTNQYNYGISVNNAQGVNISQNWIIYNGLAGIILDHAQHAYVANNGIARNADSGIVIGPGCLFNQIGFGPTRALAPGNSDCTQENYISNNAGPGVLVLDHYSNFLGLGNATPIPTYGNNVAGNSFIGNTGPNIQLSLNDFRMADPDPKSLVGPNGFQNSPVITGITGFKVEGTLNSAPSSDYIIDFYSGTSQGGAIFGEGGPDSHWLYSISTRTDASGKAHFTQLLPVPDNPDDDEISCTATSSDGSTSEYSAAKPIHTTISLEDSEVTLHRSIPFYYYFAVVRTGDAHLAASVKWKTDGGTAIAGQDYKAASGLIHFPPNKTFQECRILILDKGSGVLAPNFNIVLSNVHGASLGIANTTVTIKDGFQPDNVIDGDGLDVIDSSGLSESSQRTVIHGRRVSFQIRILNAGSSKDTFTVQSAHVDDGFTHVYTIGGTHTDVTAAVDNGTYTVGPLDPQTAARLVLEVTVPKTAVKGDVESFTITSTSTNDATAVDAVQAVVIAK